MTGNISLTIELNTDDLNIGDKMMKKLLRCFSVNELDIITAAKTTKTVVDVTMSSDMFEELKDNDGR